MPGDGEHLGSGSGAFEKLTTFYTHLDGTTLTGDCEVVGSAVPLTSTDFGEASAGLDGQGAGGSGGDGAVAAVDGTGGHPMSERPTADECKPLDLNLAASWDINFA